MRVRGGVRGAAGLGGWLSARGWCAGLVAVVVGMPLVTAAHAPAAVRYRVTRTIYVGGEPYGGAVDPASRTVYVTNRADNTVSVIDAATGTVPGTIPVGTEPYGVAAAPAAGAVRKNSTFSAYCLPLCSVTFALRAAATAGSTGAPRPPAGPRPRWRPRH